MPFKLPKVVSKSRDKSTALLPFTPMRKKIAKSYASESAFAPCWSSFSRGRSSSGQSVIAMFTPFYCIQPISLADKSPIKVNAKLLGISALA